MPAKDFERLLLDSIDDTLSSTEEKLKKATYTQLEALGIPRYEIPRHIGVLARVIEKVYETSADDVELLMIKLIYEKNGWPYRKVELNEMMFSEQIERLCGRMYSEIISKMQSPVAVFHLEDASRLSSLRLIAINSSATRTTGVSPDAIGRPFLEVYPELSRTLAEKTILEVLRSGRAKSLGKLESRTEQDHVGALSATAFPFSSNCVGLTFKQATENNATSAKWRQDEKRFDDEEDGLGDWRWELDTLGRQVSTDRSRARERWVRKEITHEQHRADYFSIRGKEYLENGDLLRAREFFQKAEEMHERSNEIEDAFENASQRIRTYIFEENVPLKEYLQVVEEYLHKYADFFMRDKFIENLAYYAQWKGFRRDEEHRFEEARASYAEAEEMFLTLKQKNKALFNASRRALTYRTESMTEAYEKSAEEFFDKYSEFVGNKYYKEVRAHYYSCKAEKSDGASKAITFRSEAERLFLEVNQRSLAFENACRLLDLYWENIPSKDGQLIQKCLETTESFFEKYQDFSEHEYYRKRMAEYYLLQARALASQLKEVLH